MNIMEYQINDAVNNIIGIDRFGKTYFMRSDEFENLIKQLDPRLRGNLNSDKEYHQQKAKEIIKGYYNEMKHFAELGNVSCLKLHRWKFKYQLK